MRSQLAVSVLLATCLLASAALAAPDKVQVTFDTFGASGVVGEATLNPMPNGEIQIHASFRGLEPGVSYIALLYDQSLTCGEGTSSLQVIQFEANPAGVAVWNSKVDRELSTIQSIGIRTLVENQLTACGTVVQ